MSIIRVHKHESNYVQLDKTCLNDTSLSWRAKGLHAYLISKPDDWCVRVTHLITQSTEGKDATRTALNELRDAGYVFCTQLREDSGKLSGTDWDIYETPQLQDVSPDAGQPDTVQPDAGESATTKERDIPKNDCSIRPPTSRLSEPVGSTISPEGTPTPSSPPKRKPQRRKRGTGGIKEPKKTWLTPFDDIWRENFGGKINFGEAGKRLRPLVEEYGEERVVAGWAKHCSEEGRHASPGHFAMKPMVWMPKKKDKVQYTDLSGVTR